MEYIIPSEEFIDAFNENQIAAIDSCLMKPEYLHWVYHNSNWTHDEYIFNKFSERHHRNLVIEVLCSDLNRKYIDTYDIIRHLDNHYRSITEDFSCSSQILVRSL